MGMGQAMKDATAFIKTKPDEAFALLKKRFPTLDDKLLKPASTNCARSRRRRRWSARPIIENSEKFNVDAGLLKADEKLKSYDGMFTNEYVK